MRRQMVSTMFNNKRNSDGGLRGDGLHNNNSGLKCFYELHDMTLTFGWLPVAA